jgi:uncharacterized protein (TIGR02246 family)
MKRHVYLILIAAISLSCNPVPDQSELRSEIEKANVEFMNAARARDAAALATLYSEDAKLMFPNMRAIEGRTNIQGFFQQAMDNGISEIRLTTDEVTGTTEYAVEGGRYVMLAGGKTVDEGKYMVEWKNVDGKWRLHRDMPSSDMPAAQPQAQPDQSVGIAVFKVKKGNQEKFETFVRDVLMKAVDTNTSHGVQAVKAIRMLRAKAPEKDGSRKVIFIFDPLYEDVEYGIQEILVARHGAVRGKELDEEFGSLVTPFYEYHDMTQLVSQ